MVVWQPSCFSQAVRTAKDKRSCEAVLDARRFAGQRLCAATVINRDPASTDSAGGLRTLWLRLGDLSLRCRGSGR